MLNGSKQAQNSQNKAPAPIVISLRLEGKDNLGKGAFYDHYTIQHQTGYPTAVVHADHPKISIKPLSSYILDQQSNLPHSPMDTALGKHSPSRINLEDGSGLLVIPGMARESYDKQPETHCARIAFEQDMIREALRRGRPIVAICAGSWTLWESLGGQLVSVNDHNYGGGMPRIGAKGTITYNVHIHDVIIKGNSTLGKAMDLGCEEIQTLPANSIHWMAPDASRLPVNFEVAATAKKNSEVSLKTRQGNLMCPTEESVEAFSSIHGAPIIGFVWHPEAFNWTKNKPEDVKNRGALLYMAKAGQSYADKQKMLAELRNTANQIQKDKNTDNLAGVFSKMRI